MKEKFTTSVTKIVDSVEGGVKQVEKTVDIVAKPARTSLLKRFPVLFTLVVTFGVAATFFGFERILMEIPSIYNHPWIMLALGIGVLTVTGTLYKKLG